MATQENSISGLDYATIDQLAAKGRRERAQAVAAFFRALFSAAPAAPKADAAQAV